MERIIGACGLICSECEAYQATQAGDRNWVEQVVEKWKVEYSAPNLTVEGVMCDGCMTASARKCGNCYECAQRLCAQAKGVANCGECAEYESCQRVQDFFKFVPAAKIVLDEIHYNISHS